MNVNVIESTGVSGMKVELSLQDCINIKSLVKALNNSVKDSDNYGSRERARSVLMTKASTFLGRITGEITSLEESAKELFEVAQSEPIQENEVKSKSN